MGIVLWMLPLLSHSWVRVLYELVKPTNKNLLIGCFWVGAVNLAASAPKPYHPKEAVAVSRSVGVNSEQLQRWSGGVGKYRQPSIPHGLGPLMLTCGFGGIGFVEVGRYLEDYRET